ncbi:MAG: hypothetical protein RB296_10690 [Acidobacteriota bacterium]|nr:hypothetical protein [Acidobacteriota bacterium]
MKRNACLLMLLIPLVFMACGNGASAPAELSEEANAAAVDTEEAMKPEAKTAAVSGPSGFQSIADFSEAWNELFKQNESAINSFEGMPIMELITPQLTFVTSVQYDGLNLNHTAGRHEGKLILAGFDGFVEKTADKIVFGYDAVRDKDGMGSIAQKGDHLLHKGFLETDPGYYHAEEIVEREGKTISRSINEFKRLADGSMIALYISGKALNFRGDSDPRATIVFLHNGPQRYDFVIAKSEAGPEFVSMSFSDKGDLTRNQAMELFKNAGYTVEKTGGIRDGKLFTD